MTADADRKRARRRPAPRGAPPTALTARGRPTLCARAALDGSRVDLTLHKSPDAGIRYALHVSGSTEKALPSASRRAMRRGAPGRTSAEVAPASRRIPRSFDWASVLSFERFESRAMAEGTLREHQRGHTRPCTVTRAAAISAACGAFVPEPSRSCPRFPLRRSMVRRGSAVRVRQRASRSRCI
jgi:hypothetical protein